MPAENACAEKKTVFKKKEFFFYAWEQSFNQYYFN